MTESDTAFSERHSSIIYRSSKEQWSKTADQTIHWGSRTIHCCEASYIPCTKTHQPPPPSISKKFPFPGHPQRSLTYTYKRSTPASHIPSSQQKTNPSTQHPTPHTLQPPLPPHHPRSKIIPLAPHTPHLLLGLGLRVI